MAIKLKVEDDGITRLVGVVSNLELGTKFYDGVGAIVAGDIIGNVENSRQADGSPIKGNARSTREKKRRQGNVPVRPLIDSQRRFIGKGKTSWLWRPTKKGVTVEPTSVGRGQPLKKLMIIVQEKGYTGWFGISRNGMKAIEELLRARIERILKKV